MVHPTQQRYNNKRRRGPREVGGSKTGDGLSKLKKRIRDLERVLKRPVPMDESKRLELERAVAAYKVEAEDLIGGRNTKKNAEKYRMIRFFERQKASRKVKQARKLLETAEDAGKKKEAEKLVEKYTADLAYTIHFPMDVKYISLYPNGAVDETTESSKQREQYRTQFAEQIKNGEIDVDLARAEQVGTTKKSKKREAGTDEAKAEEEDDEFLMKSKKQKVEVVDKSDVESDEGEEESDEEEFVNEEDAQSEGKPESEEDSEDEDDESE